MGSGPELPRRNKPQRFLLKPLPRGLHQLHILWHARSRDCKRDIDRSAGGFRGQAVVGIRRDGNDHLIRPQPRTGRAVSCCGNRGQKQESKQEESCLRHRLGLPNAKPERRWQRTALLPSGARRARTLGACYVCVMSSTRIPLASIRQHHRAAVVQRPVLAGSFSSAMPVA